LRELVAEALRRERAQRSNGDDDSVVRRQHAAWDALQSELSSLPVSDEAKGFSGADHDEVLYG